MPEGQFIESIGFTAAIIIHRELKINSFIPLTGMFFWGERIHILGHFLAPRDKNPYKQKSRSRHHSFVFRLWAGSGNLGVNLDFCVAWKYNQFDKLEFV